MSNTKKTYHPNRNDFITFKNRFPNMSSVLTDIMNNPSQTSGKRHQKIKKIKLETIFKCQILLA